MDKFKQELIEGIIEVANETGLTTDKCIKQALELLEKEQKE